MSKNKDPIFRSDCGCTITFDLDCISQKSIFHISTDCKDHHPINAYEARENLLIQAVDILRKKGYKIPD